MTLPSNKLGDYLHYFLCAWLPRHRQVSPHTRAGYKQTFRLLLRFWKARFPDSPHPSLDDLQVGPLLQFLSLQEWLGHVSINTTCRYKAVSLERKREALEKFYLFDTGQSPVLPPEVDWDRYPDLLAFLEAL
jgi:hypothetical protein